MRECDLTCEQARILHEQIGQHLRYFRNLRERMERTGWEPNDRLFMLVKETHDNLHHLYNRFHGLSVSSGMGKTRKQ